jgi:hypothetical protein
VSTDRSVVRKAAQLVALAQELGDDRLAAGADPHPIFWPGLTPDEAQGAWVDLLHWVEQLRLRYPNMTRLPECWWRHNDLVEVLSALRDYERASFDTGARLAAAVEWQRALRDMEIRMEIWIRRFSCSVPGRGHENQNDHTNVVPDGWTDFVRRDIERRTAAQEPSASGGMASPTRSPSQ